MRGAQLAGVVATAFDIEGAELSGVTHVARDVRGAQLAGIVNTARDVEGVQAALVTNVARDVGGAQLGLVNVGRNVRGVQFGLVNVAERVDGAAVGLVSMTEDGRIQPTFWSTTHTPLNAGAKFVVGSVYSLVGAGLEVEPARYRFEVGLGAHASYRRLFVEPGLHYAQTYDSAQNDAPERHDLFYRLGAGLDFGAVSPFAAAALRHEVTSPEPLDAEFSLGLALF